MLESRVSPFLSTCILAVGSKGSRASPGRHQVQMIQNVKKLILLVAVSFRCRGRKEMAGCWLPLAVLGQKSSSAHGGVGVLLAFKYCCSLLLVGQGSSPLWLLFLESFVSLEARYLSKKQSKAQRMRWPGSTTTVLGPAKAVFGLYLQDMRQKRGNSFIEGAGLFQHSRVRCTTNPKQKPYK